MEWSVAFHPAFRAEFDNFDELVQDELLAMVELLKVAGPYMKRPGTDTLKGSKHANMKELRFDASGGVWRVAYAFDSTRKAVLLIAGDKSGVSQKRFYKMLIRMADVGRSAALSCNSGRRGDWIAFARAPGADRVPGCGAHCRGSRLARSSSGKACDAGAGGRASRRATGLCLEIREASGYEAVDAP
jgi:hypothetical protein